MIRTFHETSNEMHTNELFDFEATGVTSQRRTDSQQATKGHTYTIAQPGIVVVGHTYTTLQDIVATSHTETT